MASHEMALPRIMARTLCGNLTVALENAPKPFTYGGVRKRGLTMSIRCWLNSVAVPVMLLVAGGLFASARAQDYPSVDCNNPYYYQYCQQYYAWYQAYLLVPTGLCSVHLRPTLSILRLRRSGGSRGRSRPRVWLSSS